MSADALVLPGAAAPSERVVPTLALQEGWRLLKHPLMLFGFVFFACAGVNEALRPNAVRDAFAFADSAMTYFPGMVAVLAANLLATRDHRAGAGETLSALPASQYERTKALCYAAFVPAIAGVAAVMGVHFVFLALDRYVQTPTVWHLLQGPITLLGASLFGVMIARWFPFRGAPIVALVALIAFNVWVSSDSEGALLGQMMSWPEWGLYPSVWAGLIPGSVGWHVVYLLGLCGLAATAALLRDAPRRLPVVAGGLLAVAVTVTAGLAQLP